MLRPILPGLSRSQSPADIYRYRFLIAITVTLASVLELLDTSIVNVAVPHMMGSLGATLDQIAWVSTGYVVANVIILPISGFLSNLLGRRNYFSLSVIVFTLSSFACGNASSLESLVFWRIIQGLGGGGLLSTAQATLYEVFPPEEAGSAMAIFGMGIMVGPTLGPTLGGFLTDTYSWPWIFYINLPLGALTLILTLAYVPDSQVSSKITRIDYIGLLLLAVGIGALQLMLERGERLEWLESNEVIAYAVLTFLGITTFIIRQLEIPFPIVDVRITRDSQFSAGLVFAFFLGAALYSTIFAFPVYAQTLMGYNAWDTGLLVLPSALASAVMMATTSKLVARGVNPRGLIVVGTLIFCWSMWGHYHFTTESGHDDFFWPLFFRGLGMGMIFVPLSNLAMARIQPEQMANASGLYNLTRQLGGSVGIALTATLLTHFQSNNRAVMMQHVSNDNLSTALRLATYKMQYMLHGSTEFIAKSQAFATLNAVVSQQATMVAYSKLYILFGVVLAIALPLLLIMRHNRFGGPVDTH